MNASLGKHFAASALAGAPALATVLGKGYFANLRFYDPTEAAINKSGKPGDIEKAKWPDQQNTKGQ
jgi:hypothetical protein